MSHKRIAKVNAFFDRDNLIIIFNLSSSGDEITVDGQLLVKITSKDEIVLLDNLIKIKKDDVKEIEIDDRGKLHKVKGYEVRIPITEIKPSKTERGSVMLKFTDSESNEFMHTKADLKKLPPFNLDGPE
ncbi:MAG: hypothetical protein MAG795_00438 [Candidatus Woesearchaeota archaeon]|nr:hypothetical protein [Candidatus Woesearchaeota archaeon]